jgi:thiol-disulfide isomerase/thioredoxin
MTLELPTLDGARFVRLSDFTNRPLILNFWSSECPPCVQEMPVLKAKAEENTAVQFLGIAVDVRINALRFVAAQGLGYPQLLAPKQAASLLRRFGNQHAALPYTVVLDDRDRICVTQLGSVNAAWISWAIAKCSAPEN